MRGLCVRACVRAGEFALRIASTDKILRFTNTLIIIITRRHSHSAGHVPGPALVASNGICFSLFTLSGMMSLSSSRSLVLKSPTNHRTQTTLNCAAVCNETERKGVGKRYVSNGRCRSCWCTLWGVTRCMQLHSNECISYGEKTACVAFRKTNY